MSDTSAYEIPCVPISQPIGTFYVGRVKAELLLDKTKIERRGLTDSERQNVQRRLSTDRTAQIAKYTERDNATFPTSIIVAADSEFMHIAKNGYALVLGKEREDINGNIKFDGLLPDETIGLVIDGQHRLEGIRRAVKEHGRNVLDKFELPVVFMFDMTLEDMAEVFRTINSKQRPVDPSLIIDLFGLSRQRSPRKTCHILAIGFNNEEGSPLKQGLRMLGKRETETEYLSQGSFAKYVLPLISRKPDDDELRFISGNPLEPDVSAPLRDFFIDDDDKMIAKILWNYLSAVRNVFSKEWEEEPSKHLLRKTVGFAAIMKVFKIIYPAMYEKGDISELAFSVFFQTAKENLGSGPFGADKYGSSDAEAGRMARDIINAGQR